MSVSLFFCDRPGSWAKLFGQVLRRSPSSRPFDQALRPSPSGICFDPNLFCQSIRPDPSARPFGQTIRSSHSAKLFGPALPSVSQIRFAKTQFRSHGQVVSSGFFMKLGRGNMVYIGLGTYWIVFTDKIHYVHSFSLYFRLFSWPLQLCS